jgi:triosephosphate isomerase
MPKLIVGNWKMNGEPVGAKSLATAVAGAAAQSPHTVALCPPATLLSLVGDAIKATPVKLGGQDCSPHAEGAYTGDISAVMLKNTGCSYVIVGHSERRAGHGETDATVNAKAQAALKAGLIPIICIGETLAQREAGRAEAVVASQLQHSIPACQSAVLAYEPVWAIGTGKTATNEEIGQMHQFIIAEVTQRFGLAPAAVTVLYGGSVKSANAEAILAIDGVAGVLVGGASLKAEEFGAIILSPPNGGVR